MPLGSIICFSCVIILLIFSIFMSVHDSREKRKIFELAKIGDKTAMMLLSKQLRYKKIEEIDWKIVQEALNGNPFIIEILSEVRGRK